MKNIEFLLNILMRVKVKVFLGIYGPIGDESYWNICKTLILKLPNNIIVKYFGDVHPSNVSKTFTQYDVMILPTRGENFGHVIFESLSSGTPVLISDKTPWKADINGAVKIIPLYNIDEWVKAIENYTLIDFNHISNLKNYSLGYADNYYRNNSSIQQNLVLFNHAANFIDN